ncbi:MAG: hypothetical protein HY903_20640 [Deltaproteobacteria bacterium]|nr:hypothetical protein [Deltaproteobacteria bacterium]
MPQRSAFDPNKPADLALGNAEKNELKQHFAFIARYREALRLKLNAQEDLLVNGAKEPDDRGVALHLLGKVDRTTITAALGRIHEPDAKTRFLSGVVRFARDVPILVLYLESLSTSAGRAEAAATLVMALGSINYAEVSAAQMRRLLDLVTTLVAAADRPALVLSLLASPTFRAAFDTAAEVLPAELAQIFVPMRAAYALMFGTDDESTDAAPLRQGVDLILGSPVALLKGLSESARGRLLAHALDRRDPTPSADQAIAGLLAGLPRQGRLYSQLATKRARQLLAAARDDDARRLLEELQAAQGDYKIPGRWLAALAAPRVGRIALLSAAPDATPPPGLHRGFWLEHQRSVCVVLGAESDQTAFEGGAAVHRDLALPGVLPYLTHGKGDRGVPYVAVLLCGEPATRGVRELRREQTRLYECLRSGIELLNALASCGVVLPDARLDRFLLDSVGRLLLADLTGARREPVDTALAEHLSLGKALCTALFEAGSAHDVSAPLREALAAASSLTAMARVCVAQG